MTPRTKFQCNAGISILNHIEGHKMNIAMPFRGRRHGIAGYLFQIQNTLLKLDLEIHTIYQIIGNYKDFVELFRF